MTPKSKKINKNVDMMRTMKTKFKIDKFSKRIENEEKWK